MSDTDIQRILEEMRQMRNDIKAILPLVEGIPVLGKSIDVLQRDVRTLRDDLHVTSAMAMRVDSTLTNLVTEFGAIHRWMHGVSARIQKLEDARMER